MSTAIRPRLVAVWLVFLVLAATIAFLEFSGDESAGTDLAERERMLLPVPIQQLAAVEIGHAGAMHRFERDANGVWFYHGAHGAAAQDHAHPVDPQAGERIEKALAGLGRARMEREFAHRPASDPYGVATPQMIVLIYALGDSTPLAQYAIGDVAPDTYSRYVLRLGSATVVTIADYQIDNLLALIRSFAPSSN